MDLKPCAWIELMMSICWRRFSADMSLRFSWRFWTGPQEQSRFQSHAKLIFLLHPTGGANNEHSCD